MNNLEVNFTEAVSFTSKFIKQIATYNSLFKTIRYYEDPSNKMVETREFSESDIEKSYLRNMKRHLLDPKNPDSSKIGYSTRFHALTESKLKVEISFRLGTNSIAGKDNILIEIEEKYFDEDFISKLNLIQQLIGNLIPITKPIKIVCQNYEIVDILEDNPERIYGYIAFYSTNLFQQIELAAVGANYEVTDDGILSSVYNSGKEQSIKKLLKLKTLREIRKQQIN